MANEEYVHRGARYPAGFSPIDFGAGRSMADDPQAGIKRHEEYLHADDVGQRILAAVADLSDSYGIAVGHTLGDLARRAGVPQMAAVEAGARLCVGGALLGFISKAGPVVWVLPDYEDSVVRP